MTKRHSMLFRNTLIFFAALILAACNSRNVKVVGDVLVVDVEDVCEGEDVKVETLAESVEVIPLETADGAFFEFRRACFSENYIVVRAASGLVRVFGRAGRFVGMLEGVDERTAVYDIAIDEGRGAIYASEINSDRVLAFDLAGHRQPDIKLPSRTNKAVLAADSCGVALAQFDFTDTPSGFCAATIGKGGIRHASRPSLCTLYRDKGGFVIGYNHEIVVDKERMTATRANIVSEIPKEVHFADSYAYAVLPPVGKENATLIRWKLSDKPNHKPAPKPDIPKSKNAAIVCNENTVAAEHFLSGGTPLHC